MRYRISLLTIITALLFACGSDKKENNTVPESNISTADRLKHQFLPIIGGGWVAKGYLDRLKENKSPMKSADKTDGILCVIIPFEAEKDSAWAGLDYNSHEADNFTIYFKPRKHTASLATNYKVYDRETDFFELSYTIKNADTTLFINRFDASGRLIKSMPFTRVSRETATDYVGYPAEVAVNRLLMEGSYIYTDTLATQHTVTFKRNGTLTGFGNYTNYYVNTDYTACDPEELPLTDFMYLRAEEDKYAGMLYDYTITGDTLLLWRKNVEYKLVRER